MHWHKIPNYSLQVSQVGFTFTDNHFLFENANKIVQQLTSTGMMNKLMSSCPVLNWKNPKRHPSVLTLKSLDFGFFIWLGFCVVCVVVFIFEILFWIFRRKLEIYFEENDKKIKYETKRVKNAKIYPL